MMKTCRYLALFAFLHAAAATAATPLRRYYVALKQRHLPYLEAALLDVSNPESPVYGQHWTRDEILDVVSPDPAAVQRLVQDLARNGATVESRRDHLVVNARSLRVTSLVNLRLIDQVIETRRQCRLNPRLTGRATATATATATSMAADDGFFGRETARRLYNFTDIDTARASVASIEYQGNGGFSPSDLAASQQANAQPANPMANIQGPNDGTDVESQLDVQMTSQLANNAELWFWDSPEWLYTFAVDFFGNETVPDAISMSWGWAEDRQCDIGGCSDSEQFVRRVNAEYVKIGLRGVTIVVSSGDAGAPGRTAESCDATRARNPAFPTSSPWVLSVGATFLLQTNDTPSDAETPLCRDHTCAAGTTEVGISCDAVGWTAGGGVELYNDTVPSWQAAAVASYRRSGVPLPTGMRTGRTYPDVSAVGHACPTFLDGSPESVDGTSCSSPVVAGMIAMLNARRAANGRPTLGFVNPLFYSLPHAFNDVTKGHNWCTEQGCCPVRSDGGSDFGFVAAKGYDPVTGLGTPNLGVLLAAV